MFFFLVATLFSLLTFSITGALTSVAGSLFGGTGGKYFVFKTSDGKEVGVDAAEFSATTSDLPGALQVFYTATFSNPYPNLFDPNPRLNRRARGDSRREMVPNEQDLAAAHTMLLAEARSHGIEVPPERVAELFQRYRQIFADMVKRQAKRAATEEELAGHLRYDLKLTPESLQQRLGELFVVDAYVRTVSQPEVPDPVRLDQLFEQQCTKLSLEYVEFPFATYEAELRKTPPPDSELETKWKGLSESAIETAYTRSPRYAVDLVVVDADAWDAASVPAAAAYQAPADPTDEDVIATCKGDPKRYTADGKPPAAIADLTAAERAKVKKDKVLGDVFQKLRAEFDASVAALPALEEPKPGADGKVDPDAEAKAKAAKSERIAKEKQLFADAAAKYGFTVTSQAEQDAEKLGEVDPPKDTRLQYTVEGLAAPTKSGLRTQQTMPEGDRKHAYVVRVADEPTLKRKMTFEEAKSKLLDEWVAEHGKKAALEKGEALRKAVLADAEKKVPADVLAAMRKERDDRLAAADKVKGDADRQKRDKDFAEADYFHNVEAVVGSPFGARFGEIAKELGLETKKAGPQRRNVGSTPHFADLFQGAERFLFRLDSFGDQEGELLGYDVGAVSDVLEDETEKSAYVATVTSRELPKAEEMTPSDRLRIEGLERRERPDPQFAMFGIAPDVKPPPYLDPFSMAQILRRHAPKIRARDAADGDSQRSPYGGY
jgi:hypothetical protein